MKKLLRSQKRFKGVTLGLDLHKKSLTYCIMDEQGEEVANQDVTSTVEDLSRLIDKLTAGGQAVQVALEASGCFIWAYDLLIQKLSQDRVHVAAPSRVRVIAEAGDKNDEGDAWWLAYLLWDGRLPEAFVAQGDLRELRIAARERRSAVDERGDLVRRMRSHLAQLGIAMNKNDFKSIVGRERISQVVKDVQQQHGVRGEAVARLWLRIDQLNQEVLHWEGCVSELCKKFKEIKTLDEELAGVGENLAAIVWSELGDPRRYKNAKAYAKATGLTPGYRESGGRRSNKSITREGSSHVRWALTRAIIACTHCKKGDGLAVKRWVTKMKKRKSPKAAVVAAARKLAEAVWRLFALGEAFDLTMAFGGPVKACS